MSPDRRRELVTQTPPCRTPFETPFQTICGQIEAGQAWADQMLCGQSGRFELRMAAATSLPPRLSARRVLRFLQSEQNVLWIPLQETVDNIQHLLRATLAPIQHGEALIGRL
jgi:hypothetical protein